jgi:uncharacterized damage-inducible protein DinB
MGTLLESYRRLTEYNSWMNEKLYESCAQLSDEERKRDLGAFFRSIHGTLNHLLMVDHAWLLRCTRDFDSHSPRDSAGNAIRLTSLDQILFDEFPALRAQRRTTDFLLERWVASLDDASLQGLVEYNSSYGARRHPLWWVLTHLFNHQTHHRGQVTTLVKQLGRDPGTTDLMLMMQDRYGAVVDQ